MIHFPEILRVINEEGIAMYKNDLIKLYQEAFAGHPYFESFSDDESFSIIKGLMLNEGGICCIMLFDKKVIGLCGGYSLICEEEILKLYKNDCLESVFYFAEIAVAEGYKRRGYGKQLVDYCLKLACEEGKYRIVLMRTQAVGSNSIRIFKRSGFIEISGLIQHVETLVLDKIKSIQDRCFLEKTI